MMRIWNMDINSFLRLHLKQYYKFVVLFLILLSTSCTSVSKYAPISIGVFSDPHYLSETLMDDGQAVSTYEKISGKAISEVPEILDAVINDYLTSDIDVLLIPGDMTKDGEKQSHKDFVSKLQLLIDKGVKVFIVPGNHDINVPGAVGFKENLTYPVENTSPSEFMDIYRSCGYGSAFSKDTASLSYAAKLSATTWLIALDGCLYERYTNSTISAGKLKDSTLNWALDILKKAKREKVQVIGMMHHGLVEHIPMQQVFFKNYLIDDSKRIANLFADAGMNLIFTGHFHSNDISEFTSENGNKLYDVETGALTAYAFPFRYVDLDMHKATIKTKNITKTKRSPHLVEDNKIIMKAIAKRLALTKVKGMGMSLSNETAERLADVMAKIFILHLKGDEKMDYELRSAIKSLAEELDAPPIPINEKTLNLDFPPADNNVEITF